MPTPRDAASWKELEANADRPDVQEIIRRAIRRQIIRVSLSRDGRIRITPNDPERHRFPTSGGQRE